MWERRKEEIEIVRAEEEGKGRRKETGEEK
jgi:hypothetical protein